MNRYILTALLPLFLLGCSSGRDLSVQSPDGKVVFRLLQPKDEDGSVRLAYKVLRDGREVVGESALGLEMDGYGYGRDMVLEGVEESMIDEEYSLMSGKRVRTRNHCREKVFTFKNGGPAVMRISVRVFNDGAAFRYSLSGDEGGKHRIDREYTEFAIPEGRAWIHPYDWNYRKKPSYEQFSENDIPVGTPSPYEQGWAYPMLFQTGQSWTMVTEASIDGTYPATHVDNSGRDGAYKVRFPEQEEPIVPDSPEPESSLPWSTPWRVIITGSDLNTIFASQIVAHLNPASVVEDASWIKAGRAAWSWWYDGSSVRDYQEQLKYVDLCEKMGWEYSLIDAWWQQMDGEGVEGVIRYAKEKGVGIWLWYYSGAGSNNAVMSDPVKRREEMERLRDLGVKGIKVDFFDTDKQRVMALYPAILKDAADCHLMVDLHGATLPRGLERTYPNLMSTEAVFGAEGLWGQDNCDRMAEHDATLVFTRNVVGSMDYTPVTFSNKPIPGTEAVRRTTVAHQLALSVVFESGFQCFADCAEAYLSLDDEPRHFLERVPASWDESVLLDGYPSDFAVVARRRGNTWYIGGINGKDEPRTITFRLPKECGGKTVRLICDGADADSFSYRTVDSPSEGLQVDLLGNGGFVAEVE